MDSINKYELLSKVVLRKLRINKISAEIFNRSPTGGQIQISIQATLALAAEAEIFQTISEVKIQIIGIPHEKDDKHVPAFEIEITAQGVHKWPSQPTDQLLCDNDVNNELARQIYVFCSREVRSTAERMGINGIKLDADFLNVAANHQPSKTPGSPVRKKRLKLTAPSTLSDLTDSKLNQPESLNQKTYKARPKSKQ